jgi:hypothetical protein
MKTKSKSITKKQQQTILTVLVVILVLVAIYKFVILPKRDEAESKTVDLAVNTSSGSSARLPTSTALKNVGNDTTLKKGSRNLEVKWLQWYFNTKTNPATKLATDGVFGAKTEAVVKSITGKTSTTWTEFKAKIYFKANGSILANTGAPSWESIWASQSTL